MDTLLATLALSSLPKLGPVRIRALVEQIGSPEAVLKSSERELARVPNIGPHSIRTIMNWRDHADPEAQLAELEQRGISILLPDHPTFPEALKQTNDYPLLFYVWGEVLERDRHAIGVVGSRQSTPYGVQSARKLSYQLAGAGVTVISGLARGIDTAAHEGALSHPEGRTIAVIGSGLGQLYPPENFGLAEKIVDGNGAVISEFPLHRRPDKQTFPQRNRIVAGWSKSLLVVECPTHSGSLITANMAADAGKTIYAVPGQIDRPTSAGCNHLIRGGATLVTDASDILDDLETLDFRSTSGPALTISKPQNLTEREEEIFNLLNSTETHIDTIVEQTQLPPSVVSTTLLSLELKRAAKSHPGQLYTCV